MKNLNEIILLIDDTIPSIARQAIARILVEEGGYNVASSDRGLETKYGITKRWYPNVDIANLTIPLAADIYFQDYWNFNQCGLLPDELALTFFDACVNQGGDFARKTLQKLLRVKVDGIIGPKTLNAAAAACSLIFLTQFTRERCRAYNNLVQADISQVVNVEGWNDRALDILIECQIIAGFGVSTHE
ncbi:glycoside hydrolase family 108 protein [Cognaticolwellia mytili]|uniref:glycoside hydrolase family 108 protein n=1 Tax=Cognaticolwellia mytili TaxID=1888913 RepID=UPI000A173853|nr:glycosyl hydrolase 108 family protein [Cognaticolwellia mytili]